MIVVVVVVVAVIVMMIMTIMILMTVMVIITIEVIDIRMEMMEIKMKMIIKTKHNNRTHARMHGGTGGRTERGHAKHQQSFVMLWGPLCGRNLLCLLSKKGRKQ